MFHNSNVFGSCIIHILYTGCAKIKKNNSGAKRLICFLVKCPKKICFHVYEVSLKQTPSLNICDVWSRCCFLTFGATFSGLRHIREQAGQNTTMRILTGVYRKTGIPVVDYVFVLWLEVRSLLLCMSLTLTFHREVATFTLFDIHKFHVLPTPCICMFCVDLGTNSVYFPAHR